MAEAGKARSSEHAEPRAEKREASVVDVSPLQAIEDIKVLKARYFRFVDTKQWDAFEALFTANARLEVAEARPQPFTPAELADLLRAHYGRCVTVHHGHTPEIELDGDDQATGVWAMEDQRFFEADDPSAPFASALGAGHYHETYIRTPLGWRIASLVLTRLRLEVQPLSSAG